MVVGTVFWNMKKLFLKIWQMYLFKAKDLISYLETHVYLYLWFYVGPSQQAVTSWWWLNFSIVFNFLVYWVNVTRRPPLYYYHFLVATHILLFQKPIFESLSTSKRKLLTEWIFALFNSVQRWILVSRSIVKRVPSIPNYCHFKYFPSTWPPMPKRQENWLPEAAIFASIIWYK